MTNRDPKAHFEGKCAQFLCEYNFWTNKPISINISPLERYGHPLDETIIFFEKIQWRRLICIKTKFEISTVSTEFFLKKIVVSSRGCPYLSNGEIFIEFCWKMGKLYSHKFYPIFWCPGPQHLFTFECIKSPKIDGISKIRRNCFLGQSVALQCDPHR